MQNFLTAKRALEQATYRLEGSPLFCVDKKRALRYIIHEGRRIHTQRKTAAIQCVEGVFMALYLTQENHDMLRFTMSFESYYIENEERKRYLHLVLGVYLNERFGCLGISRSRDLMTKPLQFVSLCDLILDFVESYQRCGHTLLSIKFSEVIPSKELSNQVEWKKAVVEISKTLEWSQNVKKFEDYLRMSFGEKTDQEINSGLQEERKEVCEVEKDHNTTLTCTPPQEVDPPLKRGIRKEKDVQISIREELDRSTDPTVMSVPRDTPKPQTDTGYPKGSKQRTYTMKPISQGKLVPDTPEQSKIKAPPEVQPLKEPHRKQSELRPAMFKGPSLQNLNQQDLPDWSVVEHSFCRINCSWDTTNSSNLSLSANDPCNTPGVPVKNSAPCEDLLRYASLHQPRKSHGPLHYAPTKLADLVWSHSTLAEGFKKKNTLLVLNPPQTRRSSICLIDVHFRFTSEIMYVMIVTNALNVDILGVPSQNASPVEIKHFLCGTSLLPSKNHVGNDFTLYLIDLRSKMRIPGTPDQISSPMRLKLRGTSNAQDPLLVQSMHFFASFYDPRSSFTPDSGLVIGDCSTNPYLKNIPPPRPTECIFCTNR